MFKNRQIINSKQPYGLPDGKYGQDDNIFASCFHNETREPPINVNMKTNAKSEFSVKTNKPFSIGSGRIIMNQSKFPQSIIDSKPLGAYPMAAISNQRTHHVNSFPRRTAIPIATPAFAQKNNTAHLNQIPNIMQNPNCPTSVMADPRLIHPAMEPFGNARPKIDKRLYKEKMIPKIKKNKNLPDLQKKICINSFGSCRDEVEKYAVENSPSYISLRSSLSDLTIDGSIAGVTR